MTKCSFLSGTADPVLALQSKRVNTHYEE